MIRFLTTATAVCLVLAWGGVAEAEIATSTDIGTDGDPYDPGSWAYDADTDTHTVVGGGSDIWNAIDRFHYAYEEWTGDFTAQGMFYPTYRVADLELDPPLLATHNWAKVGIMARETLANNSKHIQNQRSGHRGVGPQWRTATGGGSAWQALPDSVDVFDRPIWLKLVRQDDFFASSWAEDDGAGAPMAWSGPKLNYLPMNETLNLGLNITSHDNDFVERAGRLLHTADVQHYTVDSAVVDFPELPELVLADSPAGGMGFIGVREVFDNGDIGNEPAAHASLNSGAGTISEYTTAVLNRWDSNGRGHFLSDDLLGVVNDGLTTAGQVNQLSMIARGTIRIPAGGDYTFGINSDDGFTLQFPGNNFTSINGRGGLGYYGNGVALQHTGGGAVADALGVIDLPPGDHEFVLTWHEGDGGAAVEFFAAPGAHTGWDPAVFNLVGGDAIIGYTINPPAVPGGWDVTVMYDTGTATVLDSIETTISAWDLLDTGWLPDAVLGEATGVPVINYEDPDAGGGGKGFPKDVFPEQVDGVAEENFGLRATGQLEIVEAGTYTFTVLGDDGSRFLIEGSSGWSAGGGGNAPTVVDAGGQGILLAGSGNCCSDAWGTVDLAVGTYNMELFWNEVAGGAYVGLFGNMGAYGETPLFQLGDATSIVVPDAPAGLRLVEAGMAMPSTSLVDGTFSDGATWLDGVAPIATDDVMINHDVTVDAAANVNSLTVNGGGELTLAGGNSLTAAAGVSMAAGSALELQVTDVTGTVRAGGDVQIQSDLIIGVSGAAGEMFKAGVYTVVDSAAAVTGSFASVSDLGDYVSAGVMEDGVDYTATSVTLTIDKDLHPGDINLDTMTDLSDFNAWNKNKFLSGTGWTMGDVNGDGMTDLSDFNLWNQYKFTQAAGGAAPAPTQVPEPNTLSLLACGLLGLLAWRRGLAAWAHSSGSV